MAALESRGKKGLPPPVFDLRLLGGFGAYRAEDLVFRV